MTSPSREHPGLAHQIAIADRLEAQSGYLVYRSAADIPDDTAYPYILVWPSPATRPLVTMVGYDGTAITRNIITVAGENESDVTAAADTVSLLLVGFSPNINGRVCGTIDHQDSIPTVPTEDKEIVSSNGRPVFSMPMYFNFHSSEAG